MRFTGGNWKSVSIRKKLITTFLLISLLPIIIITSVSSCVNYRYIYQANIAHNIESLSWSQEQLDNFNNEILNIFYALEMDDDFRRSIEKWQRGAHTFSELGIIRRKLVSHLNRHRVISSFEIVFPDSLSVIHANRTGVRIADSRNSDSAESAIYVRDPDMQTNLFYKNNSSSMEAVHDMRRFEDRKLIAQIRIELRQQELQNFVSKTKLFNEENLFLFNDDMECVLSGTEQHGLQALYDFIHSENEHVGSRSELVRTAHIGQWIVFSTHSSNNKLSIGKVMNQKELVRATMPTIYTGIAVSALSIIGALLASLFLSSVMSKPLISLAKRVQAIQLHTLILESDSDLDDEVSIIEHHITLFIERIRDLIRNEYEISLQAKMAQIQALQAQLNPHFLHNTLQLIGSIALYEDAHEVYKISGALSKLMRYSMAFDDQGGSLVTVSEELSHMDNFFLIQTERFKDRITIQTSIDPDVGDCLIPKLLIQPIVENAFQHGFSKKTGEWSLNIHANIDENNKVHISVLDNGVGIPAKKLSILQEKIRQRNQHKNHIQPLRLKEHIGILNTNDRIRLLFSDDDGLQIRSVEGEFTEVEMIFDARRVYG
ncbi:sensor histidine kinase [Spirochaeta dissipatitropha]